MLPMSSLGEAVPLPPPVHDRGASSSLEPLVNVEVSALPIGSTIVGAARRLVQSSPDGVMLPGKRFPSISNPPRSLLPIEFAEAAGGATSEPYWRPRDITKSAAQKSVKLLLLRALNAEGNPRDIMWPPLPLLESR